MTVQNRLYKKALAEYEALLSEIKQLPGSEAIERAYEKVIKEDIVLVLESYDIPDSEAQALLKKDYLLDFMYHEWLDNDCSHMDMLRETISNCAKKEIKYRRDYAR